MRAELETVITAPRKTVCRKRTKTRASQQALLSQSRDD